jgi:hypothetical protein
MGVAIPGERISEHEASCACCGGRLRRKDDRSMWWHDDGMLACPSSEVRSGG